MTSPFKINEAAVQPRLGRKGVCTRTAYGGRVWKLEDVGRLRFGFGWAAVRVLGGGALAGAKSWRRKIVYQMYCPANFLPAPSPEHHNPDS